tara:strand:- start:1870 stop:2079 length:210 start_codon:yes stop_codon:yes gene_type:complete
MTRINYTPLDGVRSELRTVDQNRRITVPRWVLNELRISNRVGEDIKALGRVVFIKKDNNIVIKKVNIEV